MKYIKLFERIYGQDEVRLKEFCGETLAYLLDVALILFIL